MRITMPRTRGVVSILKREVHPTVVLRSYNNPKVESIFKSELHPTTEIKSCWHYMVESILKSDVYPTFSLMQAMAVGGEAL